MNPYDAIALALFLVATALMAPSVLAWILDGSDSQDVAECNLCRTELESYVSIPCEETWDDHADSAVALAMSTDDYDWFDGLSMDEVEMAGQALAEIDRMAGPR